MEIIDFHVHPPTKEFVNALGKYYETTLNYFRSKSKILAINEIIEDLKKQGITKAVLLPLFSALTGYSSIPNEHIKEIMKADEELFIGFAGFSLQNPIEDLKYAIEVLGLKGIKIHPQLLGITPDNEILNKVYEYASRKELPIVLHTGITGIGAGNRGGGGIILDLGRPIYVDKVASKFDNVDFIMAHFGWPWYEEALAVAYHKANVYIDISGWSPKYIPNIVFRYADSLIQDKVLFGSDYPMLNPSRIIEELKQINLKETTIKKIFYENARRLLKI